LLLLHVPVRSKFNRDTKISNKEREDQFGCPCVSAGHATHEWTPGASLPSVFNYLQEKIS
jgi:hypothetical protein